VLQPPFFDEGYNLRGSESSVTSARHAQRVIQWLIWTAAGALGVGALLDALINAGELFSSRTTLYFTAVVIALWIVVEGVLAIWGTPWAAASPRGNSTVKLRRLGPKTRAAILGVILLPWGAQLLRQVRTQHDSTELSEQQMVNQNWRPKEELDLSCHPRPSFVVGVGSKRLGVDNSLDRSVVLDCDLANVGRERLSIVNGEFHVDYRSASGSTIPLQPGNQIDNHVELPRLPLALDAGVVHRFALSFRIVRDHPSHVPVLVVETPNSGALMFPSTWSTKEDADGRPHRVDKHYLDSVTLSFVTARQTSVQKSLSLQELESELHDGMSSSNADSKSGRNGANR
jgi:hypothetical protein